MTLHVLYNGACSICAPEIDLYRRAAKASGADIVFEDLNTTDLGAWGVTPDTAMRRLHTREGGRMVAGIEAFVALWSRLPRWRWLARIVALPGIRPLATLVYDRVLAPWLYARAQRRTCALPQG